MIHYRNLRSPLGFVLAALLLAVTVLSGVEDPVSVWYLWLVCGLIAAEFTFFLNVSEKWSLRKFSVLIVRTAALGCIGVAIVAVDIWRYMHADWEKASHARRRNMVIAMIVTVVAGAGIGALLAYLRH